MTISIEPVAIRPIVGEVKGLIGPLAAAGDIEIRDHTDDLAVLADMNRLRQVLLNVLSNAVKYNRPGGSVSLATRVVGGEVLIDVSDTGIGMSPEDLPRLFKPFERLSAETGEVDGTGIGLALSRGLVELMGGSIGVESTPGQGSVFTLRLPVAKGESPVIRDAADATVAPPPVSTVLYIEDNPSNTVLVESALSLRPGIRLITAGLGRLGLDLAREHRPDLLLLDLHLPDLSGEEVLRSLKADPATATIPIIIVSADATERRVAELRLAGAREYVTKPLVIRDFLALVDATLAASTSSQPS